MGAGEGTAMDDLGLTDTGSGSREEQLFTLADTLVSEHSARDALLDALLPYYFLDAEQDPEDDDERDEHLKRVRMPHGTDVVDLVQAMLSDTELQIVVPARSDKKRDLSLADVTEAWLQALVSQNDRHSDQGLLDAAAWLVAMRGAFCARVVFLRANLELVDGVYVQGDTPPIVLQVRDPRYVYPRFGQDGLLYVVERCIRTVADIRYTWGSELLPGKKPDEEVEWTELWTRDEYCYWADGMLVPRTENVPGVRNGQVEGPWAHGYGCLPYVFQFAQQTGLLAPERRIRPMLESVRPVIDSLNMMDTVELTTLSEYGGDALVVQTLDDEFKVDLSPLAENYIRPGESIGWLRSGRQPYEAAQARGKFEAAFQRGTFPYTMYGADPGRMMSGFSLSLLNQGGQLRLRRLIRAIEEGMADLLSKALQVADRMVAPLLDEGKIAAYLRTDVARDDGGKRTIREEIVLKPEDLEGYYVVDVALGDPLPTDRQGNLVMALRTQQVGTNGRPLLSWQTAVEMFNLVDSPAEERWRIESELVAEDPKVKALRMAIFTAKVIAELREEAEELGINIEAVMAEAAAAERPPPAQPGSPAGLPSQMLPSQMQGGGIGPMGPGGPMGPFEGVGAEGFPPFQEGGF